MFCLNERLKYLSMFHFTIVLERLQPLALGTKKGEHVVGVGANRLPALRSALLYNAWQPSLAADPLVAQQSLGTPGRSELLPVT